MPIARTLSGYIARQFLTWFGAVFGTMISIAFLLDYLELIRRAGSRVQATWSVLLEMAALKLPHTAQDVMPFAILFGTMLVFWRMTRSNELVAARAAGISAWAFLAPAVLMALLIGMLAVMLFNPVASAMEAGYEQLENRILRLTGDPTALSDGALWLRQSDGRGGQVILHGEKVTGHDLVLHDVGLFFVDARSQFTGRIEAQSAKLGRGFWVIERGQRFLPGEPAEKFDAIRLATGLTSRKIEESLASPELDVVLGTARIHRAIGTIRFFGTASSAALQCPVGKAAPVLRDGAGGGLVQSADAAARRRDRLADERSRGRIPAVFPFRRRFCSGALVQNPGSAGRLDPDRRKHDLRRLDAASPRRRMTLGSPLMLAASMLLNRRSFRASPSRD